MPMLDWKNQVPLTDEEIRRLPMGAIRALRRMKETGWTGGICDDCGHVQTGLAFMLGGDALDKGRVARCGWCVKRLGHLPGIFYGGRSDFYPAGQQEGVYDVHSAYPADLLSESSREDEDE